MNAGFQRKKQNRKLAMKILHQDFQIHYRFPIIFTRDVFGPLNPSLNTVLRESGQAGNNRVVIVIDSNVLNATPDLPEKISQYAESRKELMELAAPPLAIKGGESCKNDPAELRKIHALIGKLQLCRRSFILAIGGGAVLQTVSFAAATTRHAVRVIRLPSTVLAQGDAGVAPKSGINAFGRKNFLSALAPPGAVINDFHFLKTLSMRDMKTGIARGCEGRSHT